MVLIVCGMALGFVMAWILFTQRMWRLEDKAESYKEKAAFYKNEAIRQYKARQEKEICDGLSDYFENF